MAAGKIDHLPGGVAQIRGCIETAGDQAERVQVAAAFERDGTGCSRAEESDAMGIDRNGVVSAGQRPVGRALQKAGDSPPALAVLRHPISAERGSSVGRAVKGCSRRRNGRLPRLLTGQPIAARPAKAAEAPPPPREIAACQAPLESASFPPGFVGSRPPAGSGVGPPSTRMR